MDFSLLLHHTVCGGLAAAGFGVLFNVESRGLSWCAASGALMLAARTVALERGWSMEAATFVAALAGGIAVQLLPSISCVSRDVLHLVGCIPMVPGAFATKAILGLFAITTLHPTAAGETFLTALDNTLQATFTVGALGTGLAIPTLLLRAHRIK